MEKKFDNSTILELHKFNLNIVLHFSPTLQIVMSPKCRLQQGPILSTVSVDRRGMVGEWECLELKSGWAKTHALAQRISSVPHVLVHIFMFLQHTEGAKKSELFNMLRPWSKEDI